MTVSTNTGYFSSSGDGVATEFAFNGALLTGTDLIVEQVNLTTGAITDQVEGVDYDVAIASDWQSAVVTFDTAPPATHRVVRRRRPNYLQQAKLRATGRLPAEAIEQAIDRIVMSAQAVRDTGTRAIRYNDADPPDVVSLPPLEAMLGKFLFIDLLGNPVGSDGPADIPISATMTAFVQSVTIAAALGELGFSAYMQSLKATASLEALQLALEFKDTDKRQVLASGPISATGASTLLPSTNAALTLTTQNVAVGTPLLVTSANGSLYTTGRTVDRYAYATANNQWTALVASRAAATPNFLYYQLNADHTLTNLHTILPPIEQEMGVPSTTNGQFTFNRAEMKGYMGNGTTAPQAYIVFAGEAATDGSGVISTVSYGYNLRYESAWTTGLPGVGTYTSVNHNLGQYPTFRDFVIECIATNSGFAVGERLHAADFGTFDGSIENSVTLSSTRNTVGVQAGSSQAFNVITKSVGTNPGALDPAKWKYMFVARVER